MSRLDAGPITLKLELLSMRMSIPRAIASLVRSVLVAGFVACAVGPQAVGYNLYFEHPSTNFAVREIVMYNPRGEQDISGHAFDLLQLSPEDIRRQRGYFASYDLSQAGWRRFLFD